MGAKTTPRVTLWTEVGKQASKKAHFLVRKALKKQASPVIIQSPPPPTSYLFSQRACDQRGEGRGHAQQSGSGEVK